MVTPYLLFNGNCREAMDFYETALNGRKKKILVYGDYTTPEGIFLPEEQKSHVMHGEMELCGVTFWFADELESVIQGNSIHLTLHYQTEAEARMIYDQLRTGGKTLLEPTPQYYCAVQAAVEDRYGIRWHIIGMK